jgi:hypothetical protein
MKAVNQCIGRVIRHRSDWAAVVLADVRWTVGGISAKPDAVDSHAAILCMSGLCHNALLVCLLEKKTRLHLLDRLFIA